MPGEHDTLHKAPLIEVVFELRAETAASVTVLPGKMAMALEGDYPVVQETEVAKFLAIAALPLDAGFAASHQFRASDGGTMVQLGPMGLTVNALAYAGFAGFRAAVAQVIRRYFEHASVGNVRRLGLRYINRLPAAEKPALSGLTASLNWPEIEGATAKSIAVRGVFTFSKPSGQLAVAIAAPAQFSAPHQAGRLLDLDFSFEPSAAMTAQDILSWVDTAHARIYEAFRDMVEPSVFQSWR